jgi:hypothetical protein
LRARNSLVSSNCARQKLQHRGLDSQEHSGILEIYAARVVLMNGAMETRRSVVNVVATWLSESLREMAVLIAVFAPLDVLVQGRPLTLRGVGATIRMVVLLFASGVALEVQQWKKH